VGNDIETKDISETASQEKSGDRGVMASLWYVFSSMKTAIVLLLLLAAVSTAAATLESKYGWQGLYQSTPYVILLALVGVNLAVCSINRFGISWRRTFSPTVSVKEKQIAGMSRTENISTSGTVENASNKTETALRSSSYHIVKAQEGDAVVLYASKGRLSIWGPYLTHLSLLLIFAGALIGGKFGFDGYTGIAEGDSTNKYYSSKTEKEHNLGFQVFLKKFNVEMDSKGHITGYKSDLTIFDKGKEVAHKVIDVNRPLTYKGVSFFQSSYGLAAFNVKVTAPNGKTDVIAFGVSKQGDEYAVDDMAPKMVKVGDKHLAVFAHGFQANSGGMGEAATVIDPSAQLMVNDQWPENKDLKAWKPLGWLTSGPPVEYNGWKIAMGDVTSYTGLQVSKNPGLPIIYAGFALILLGVIASFYIPHKVIRARISPSGKGASVLMGAFTRAEASTFDRDFDRVKKAL